MNYMLMTYETQSDFDARNGPNAESYWGAWKSYTQALVEAGVLVGGNALAAPHTATTIGHRDEKRRVQDGPFADSKEQLGGYYIIDVADLDQALDWAARCPAADTGIVEVRPILEM